MNFFDNPALDAIEARVFALPSQIAFDTLTSAIRALPIVDPHLTLESPASVQRTLRNPQMFQFRLLSVLIDFARDPDDALPRLDALLAVERAQTKWQEEIHHAASYARRLRPFAAVFRKGDSLLAEFARQRAAEPEPAPASLAILEDKALALPPALAFETLHRALASLGNGHRNPIKPYASQLPTPELLHAALGARHEPEFRVLAMIIAYANDRPETLGVLERVAAECAAYTGTAEAYGYGKLWAAVLPASQVRFLSFDEQVAKVIAAGRIDYQDLEWLPELATAAQRQAVAERFAGRIAESKGIDGLVAYCVGRMEVGPSTVPFFARLLGLHPQSDTARAAMLVLSTVDDDGARRALAALLDAPGIAPDKLHFPMIAAVKLAMDDLDALRGLVDRCGRQALAHVVTEIKRTKGFKKNAPAWARFAASYVRKHPEESAALLRLLPKKEAAAATAEVAPPKVYPAMPASPRWLARYEAGEHAEVWKEMLSLGPAAYAHPEAASVARATMQRVRENIVRQIAHLAKHGYPVKALPKVPLAKLDATVAAIEKLAGVPVPLSLRAFWEVVGTVDFRPLYEHKKLDPSWAEFEQLDPFQIWDPKPTQRWLKERPPQKSEIAALREPVAFAIGLDEIGKVDEDSAEGALGLVVTDAAVDGMLDRAGDAAISFVQYLREVLARGGFYGIDGPKSKEWTSAAQRTLARIPQEPF